MVGLILYCVVGCGLIVAYAEHKGRPVIVWYFIALFITPVLAALLLLMTPKSIEGGKYKKCSKCQEVVKIGASICKNCNSSLSLINKRSGEKVECTHCNFPTRPGATCEHCDNSLEEETHV